MSVGFFPRKAQEDQSRRPVCFSRLCANCKAVGCGPDLAPGLIRDRWFWVQPISRCLMAWPRAHAAKDEGNGPTEGGRLSTTRSQEHAEQRGGARKGSAQAPTTEGQGTGGGEPAGGCAPGALPFVPIHSWSCSSLKVSLTFPPDLLYMPDKGNVGRRSWGHTRALWEEPHTHSGKGKEGQGMRRGARGLGAWGGLLWDVPRGLPGPP